MPVISQCLMWHFHTACFAPVLFAFKARNSKSFTWVTMQYELIFHLCLAYRPTHHRLLDQTVQYRLLIHASLLHLHTHLHVIVSVWWTGITRSPLEPSRMGGVIEKPITRPEGGNRTTALVSCYTDQSGPSGFDRAAGQAVKSQKHIRNLKPDMMAAQIARCSLHLQAVRQSAAKGLGPWSLAMRTPSQRNHGPLMRQCCSSSDITTICPWFITNAFTPLTSAWLIQPVQNVITFPESPQGAISA